LIFFSTNLLFSYISSNSFFFNLFTNLFIFPFQIIWQHEHPCNVTRDKNLEFLVSNLVWWICHLTWLFSKLIPRDKDSNLTWLMRIKFFFPQTYLLVVCFFYYFFQNWDSIFIYCKTYIYYSSFFRIKSFCEENATLICYLFNSFYFGGKHVIR
jgi:hypothetical protein